MKNKRLISYLMSLMCLFIFLIPNHSVKAASQFSDVTMYNNQINDLYSKGIIKGYQDGTFRPQEPIKRLQAVQMILKVLNITDISAPPVQFTDLKQGDYGYNQVAKAVQLGFIKGKADGSFDPWGYLTRAQMAVIMTKAFDLSDVHILQHNPYFKDVPSDFWAKTSIHTLASNRIASGYPDGTFRPNQHIQRNHFSVILVNYLNKIVTEKTVMHFNQTISHIVSDPNNPVIYGIDTNKEILKANYQTNQLDKIPFNLTPDSLYLRGNSLYAGLQTREHSPYWLTDSQTGAIASIDTKNFILKNQFNIKLDPFDIVADDSHIYVDSGSGQLSNFNSYDATTGKLLSSIPNFLDSTYLFMDPSLKQIFTLYDGDMNSYEILNGQLTGQHARGPAEFGTFTNNVSISPDGNFLFSSPGYYCFITDSNSPSIVPQNDLINSYQHISFDLDHTRFYIVNHNLLYLYDYATFNLLNTYYVKNNIQKLFVNNGQLYAVATDNSSAYFVESITLPEN